MPTLIDAPERSAHRPRLEIFELELSNFGPNHISTYDENFNKIRTRLNLSAKEFDKIATDLLASWQNEIGFTREETPLQLSSIQSPTDGDSQRVIFAASGNYAFRKFIDAVEQPIRNRILSDLTTLAEVPLVFLVDRVFPWRMLYAPPGDPQRIMTDDDSPAAVQTRGFLGLAGVVDHMLPISEAPRLGDGRRVPVGIYQDFRSLAGGRSEVEAVLRQNSTLHPEFCETERDLAKNIASDGAQLIYLFCHGRFRPSTAGQPIQELLLRPSKALTGSELDRRLANKLGPHGKFLTSPIAFVNACQGGVFNIDTADTIVDRLRRYGAVSTLAPLVDIPICFAGEFGTNVLRALVRGDGLSNALLSSSVNFAASHRNLLGLAYATVNGRNSRIEVDPNIARTESVL